MASNSIPLSSYQIRLLAVLALINFVNFADRQVVVPLLPLLRQQMNVTDAQLGSLQTWLLVVLAVASVPCGFFADRSAALKSSLPASRSGVSRPLPAVSPLPLCFCSWHAP